jgi:hypothetical protein
MNTDQSHRFALTGHDPQGRNRTIILWREVDLIGGTVVRRVVLTCAQILEVAQAILDAAR